MSSYSLFLDDLRIPNMVTWVELPKIDWFIVRSYEDFIFIINKRGVPEIVSFDHDLSIVDHDKHEEKTGFHCAKWLVEHCLNNNIRFPEYYIHSKNIIGAENIKSYITSYLKSQEN